jgi:hypothetical protein
MNVFAVVMGSELPGGGPDDGGRHGADDAGELEDEDGHGFSTGDREISSSFLSLDLAEHCTDMARAFTPTCMFIGVSAEAAPLRAGHRRILHAAS